MPGPCGNALGLYCSQEVKRSDGWTGFEQWSTSDLSWVVPAPGTEKMQTADVRHHYFRDFILVSSLLLVLLSCPSNPLCPMEDDDPAKSSIARVQELFPPGFK